MHVLDAGAIFNYCLVQVCLWIVMHTIFLFWAVVFPFSYRQFRASGRGRYAHVICVILAVFMPLIGPCIQLKDGYRNTSSPAYACAARDLDVTYYTTVLPVSFAVGITSSLLVVLLWIIFKVHCIWVKSSFCSVNKTLK